MQEPMSASDLAQRVDLIDLAPEIETIVQRCIGVGTERELLTVALPLDARQLEQLAEFDHSHEDWTHPERWTRKP